MTATSFAIAVGGDDTVTGLHYAADASTKLQTAVILGHGAGAPQESPFMRHFARGLASRGVEAVTFNFLYMERGRRAPDPAAKLEATYRTVIETVRERMPTATTRIVIGGKSMGGRIASQIASGDDAVSVDGLVFLGYPLHPPGRPERLRSAHLPSIRAPMLFVQGGRDPFGTPDELGPILSAFVNTTLYVVDGGDHSLRVRGRDAAPVERIYGDVQDAIVAWITRTGRAAGDDV